MLDRVAEIFSVPSVDKNTSLRKSVQEISDFVKQNGYVSGAMTEYLLETAISYGVEVNTQMYEDYAPLRKDLRRYRFAPLTGVEYSQFREKYRGKLFFKEGGTPVDVAYQELSQQYPELLPQDIINSYDQMQKLGEVYDKIKKNEYSLKDYLGEDAPQFKQDTKETLETAIKEFEENIINVQRYDEDMNRQRLAVKKANYTDAGNLAYDIGTALSQAFGSHLSGGVLPEGKLYYNIAQSVVRPMLEENYEIVSDIAKNVQQALNDAANIGIKAQVAQLNNDRIDGIINKLSNGPLFDEVAWVLKDPVTNFSQSIVDDTLKANMEFQGKAGRSPKIIRTAESKCCKWCNRLEGKYTYPDVPKEVFQRHDNCRCSVEYDPGSGKKQNVHSKQWTGKEKSDRIKSIKKLSEKTVVDTSQYPHNFNGTLSVNRIVQHSLPKDVLPNEIIDVVSSNGRISRTIFDENKNRVVRIDTTDHGFPKQHPMGSHKHIIQYNELGEYIKDGNPIALNAKDRKENADIL